MKIVEVGNRIKGDKRMKREIKFRGLRIDGEGWVNGSLVMVCDGETLKRYPCIVISYNHDTFDWIEVISESVGQFIGLQDKNGVDIFQGDKLQDSSGRIMIVSWNDKFASFCLESEGWMHSHFFGEACNPSDVEIIGNIHKPINH